MSRRIWRVFLISIWTLLVVLLHVKTVFAHATILRSEPADSARLDAAPTEIRLWFDEEISAQFSSVRFFDANGRQLPVGNIRTNPDDPTNLLLTPPNLEPGTYSVLWKVLSQADGHYSQGLLVFGVGQAADIEQAKNSTIRAENEWGSLLWPEIILRWANFGLLLTLIGALIIWRVVLIPAVDSSQGTEPQKPLVDELSLMASNLTEQAETDNAYRAMLHRVLHLALWSALLTWIVGWGFLLWQVSSVLETLPENAATGKVTWQILSQTRWGGLWVARQLILLLLCLYIPLLKRHEPGIRFQVIWTGSAFLSLGLLVAHAMNGHAAGITSNMALAITTDVLHLSAASIWMGGLAALVVGLFPFMIRQRSPGGSIVGVCWRSFSWVAALSVALLTATGLYSMGQQVASIDALLTTLYGRVLVGKLGLFLLVGCIGLLNAFLLHPTWARPLAWLFKRPEGWTPLSRQQMPTLVLAELGTGLLVLLATGVMTASQPPRGLEYTINPDNVPEALSHSVDDLVVTLQVKPNRPGQNVFTVFSASTKRPAPAEINRVLLRFRYLEEESGLVTAVADEVDPGRYMLTGNQLSLAGSWQIDVVTRRLGMEDSVVRLNWVVAPPGGSRANIFSTNSLKPILTLSAASLLLLVLVGCVLVRFRLKPNAKEDSSGLQVAYSNLK